MSEPADPKRFTVRLLVDADLPLPAQHAAAYLRSVLVGRGVRLVDSGASADLRFVAGLPGDAGLVGKRLAAMGLAVPEAPESLVIAKRPGEVVVSGRDGRGLAYGLYEVAEAIRTAPADADLANVIRPQSESPLLSVRSVQTQLFNHDLERGWYESEAYWHWFFGMLARHRFNAYTLTFGHNTNYLVPPYAYLFEVPGYPGVRVQGLGEAQRAANLAHFQAIACAAQEHGIDLTVGLWTQLPLPDVFDGLSYGPSPVENLPPGLAGGDYCAKGLRELLVHCPGITGVQLRMNLESGIPHDQQEAYYRAQFDAIVQCGRPVKLDLRFKSLSQQTIDLAVSAGLDVTVSTKFWCEHLGLPFHPTEQDPAYSESRYGYGAMLKRPRNHRVTYRLWNVGSSRLLLWGDPNYAARFARSCTLGGGEGFEVFAPLSYRGYGNEPGESPIFADRSLEHFEWEQERFWAFYLSFGRWGYNPETPCGVWDRAFEERFGEAGPALARAQRLASQVLPLLTATTQFSANSWRFWPELMPCLPLDAYRAIQPSDHGQFYAIAPFSSRPPEQWRAEGWAAIPPSFVEDALADRVGGKWTPLMVSQLLEELAADTEQAVREAESAASDPQDRELHATACDLRVLAGLARYHAAKKRAATDLEFFRVTGDKQRLPLVWRHIRSAQNAWRDIVRITDGVYSDRLVLGFCPEHHSDYRDRLQDHTKHWKDWQADVDGDVAYVAMLLQDHGLDPDADVHGSVTMPRRHPGEVALLAPPTFTCARSKVAVVGEPLTVTATVSSREPLRDVLLHYRAVDQTQAWQHAPMIRDAQGEYLARIPADAVTPRYDMMYYLEARVAGGGCLWPDWRTQEPYVVVPVRR